tara:strand:+ start:178 stop:579 length:402 start_codon:yes stop_codon:yes gene_type:complete
MSDNNKIINTTSSTTNNDFNPMPMDSKSYIDNKDFYTKSLLNQKKQNANNEFLSRHFYKIPENNQDSFAKSLFPNTSICRDTGYLCRVQENSIRNLNRISFEKDKYVTQNLNLNQGVKDKLVDILDSNDGVTD